MSELPIEGPIARVAVEAHLHRLTVVRRHGDLIAVACAVLRRWRGAIRIIAGRLCRLHASRRRLPRRCRRHPGERKLRALGGLQRSDQLANRLLADPQPVRDRPVAHPLAFQHLDAAQTFPRDMSSKIISAMVLRSDHIGRISNAEDRVPADHHPLARAI